MAGRHEARGQKEGGGREKRAALTVYLDMWKPGNTARRHLLRTRREVPCAYRYQYRTSAQLGPTSNCRLSRLLFLFRCVRLVLIVICAGLLL